jgi:hypothetical protein
MWLRRLTNHALKYVDCEVFYPRIVREDKWGRYAAFFIIEGLRLYYISHFQVALRALSFVTRLHPSIIELRGTPT